MTNLVRSSTLLGMLLATATVAGCGDPPEKISKPRPDAAGAAAAHSTVRAASPMLYKGKIVLAGTLADAKAGSVFVIVRQPRSKLPTLTRKYEIGDPLWTGSGGERVLYFSLDETHNMGGAASPPGEKMELEARFDPDGMIDTKDGIASSVVEVGASGATDVSVTLRSDAATPPAGG